MFLFLFLILVSSTALAATIQSNSAMRSYAYITNPGRDTVSVIDTTTNKIISTVNVGIYPVGVAVDSPIKKVYVTNEGNLLVPSNNISVIDTTTNQVTATVNLGNYSDGIGFDASPRGIAVNPDGTKVYVVDEPSFDIYPGNLYVIDTATNNVITSVNVGYGPFGVAVSPDGKKVYVTNQDNVSVIDAITNKITATVNVGSNPCGVTISPDGNKVYVTTALGSSGEVSVIDAATNKITATVNIGYNPCGVAVTPDGTKVYVANSLSNNVSVINAVTNTIEANVNVGIDPCGVAVTPDGTKVYVANTDSNNVSVIDTATNKITATVPVRIGSFPMAFGQFIGYLPSQPILSDFATNIIRGYAPFSVQFTDLSENATAWNWDFENDGITDSTERNPIHVYTDPGTYTVNLTVSNKRDTASKLSAINVFPALHLNGQLNITETRITTNESKPDLPDINKDRIVYMDNRSGNWDIYMYNLSTSKETQITADKSTQAEPAIYSDKIVWIDYRNGWDYSTIYMYELSTSKETQIVSDKSDKSSPKIYGDKIIWIDYRSGHPDIYMYDLLTSKETQITTNNNSYQLGPAIYGDKVVWTDNYDIYMYNISTSKKTRITTSESAIYPAIYGDRIVWIDSRNGNADIYMYNLSTSKEIPIIIDESNQTGPIEIYGDRIVWMNNHKEGSSSDGKVGYYSDHFTGNWDIYMYNLSTSTETQITTNKLTQWQPAIYDDRIMWMDNRNDNWDIYVCTVPEEESVSNPPISNFFAIPMIGNFPLYVQFTDLSQNIMSRNWDFENDGIVDSTDATPFHVYTVPGTYTAKLTVSNENGIASKTATIIVTEQSNSSGSSDGSHHSSNGGGGAGSSPEPQNNVEVKELSQAVITNGKYIKFDFTKSATCVVYVSFDAKKTFGKTTTIAEQLKGKSALVSGMPSGEVYKSFNIWIGNGDIATSKNIENPVVCFKVEKDWIKDKKINPDSIIFNRYSDKKWKQFTVNLSGEDNKYLYFTARTSGFSSFAITDTTKQSKETVTKLNTDYPETINKNNTNKESQNEQKTILKTPGFEVYYGLASLFTVLMYKLLYRN